MLGGAQHSSPAAGKGDAPSGLAYWALGTRNSTAEKLLMALSAAALLL